MLIFGVHEKDDGSYADHSLPGRDPDLLGTRVRVANSQTGECRFQIQLSGIRLGELKQLLSRAIGAIDRIID